MEKSTHEPYRTELFMPIMKSVEGDYMGVLSDDSVDRDDETVSKSCIEKMGKDSGYLAALCNHKNDVFMQVAEWTNKGIKNIDGHTALIAVPKFYNSNPNAQIIKGMLDEGAQIGISIGAMVKDYEDVNGKRVYTELELVEASFVAVPSNRHGRAMAIAKSYNTNKEVRMDLTQKDIDSAVEKKAEEMKVDFSKQLEEKDSEITKLKKELEEASEASKSEEEKVKELEAAKAEADGKSEETDKKLKAAEEALEKEKKKALEKAKFSDGAAKTSPEETDKALKEGKLPVMRLS